MGLTTVYHIIFLLLFTLTALITLGGILRWRFFEKIELRYLNKLFYALIVQVVAGVILVYTALPTPSNVSLERYNMDLSYGNYASDWLELQSKEVKKCINNWQQKNKTNGVGSSCKQDIINFEIADKSAYKTGSGEVFLVVDNKNQLVTGVWSYTFPGEAYPILVQLRGQKKTDGTMKLHFIQPERPRRIDGEVRIREAKTYRVDFKKSDNNLPVLEGTLYHPDFQDPRLKVGTIQMTPNF